MRTGKGCVTVKVNQGEFLIGRDSGAKELNLSPSTFWRHLNKLKVAENICLKSDTHWTIVTICNWNTYQDIKKQSGQATDGQRTGNGLSTDTDNNDNNVKNDEKLDISLRKSNFETTVRGLNYDLPNSEIDNFIDYWTAMNPGDKKMPFEKQKNFIYTRRLGTWKKNFNNRLPFTGNHNKTEDGMVY